jgi:hypothetical protein
MSVKPLTVKRGGVTLIRIGTGKQEFDLPEGATLADLLRVSGVEPETQSIFIDGKPLAEALVLPPGTIVSAIPRTKDAPPTPDWSGVIGAFHDNPEFEEMMRAVNAEREAEKERP